MESIITLGKLIGLLFLFCHHLLSILFMKTRSPCNGNHFSSSCECVRVNNYVLSGYSETAVRFVCSPYAIIRRRNYMDQIHACSKSVLGG